MAYFEGFKCDVCGALHTPSNGWFIGFNDYQGGSSALTLIGFIEEYAKDATSVLLCGESCMQKFVSGNLGRLHKETA